jgi:hypothetical protein
MSCKLETRLVIQTTYIVFNQYSIFSNKQYFIQYFKEFNAKKNACKSDLELKKSYYFGFWSILYPFNPFYQGNHRS